MLCYVNSQDIKCGLNEVQTPLSFVATHHSGLDVKIHPFSVYRISVVCVCVCMCVLMQY